MTSDDQHFLDLLSIVPRDVRRYSKEVVNAIDRGFDNVALSVREHLDLDAWWPQSSRPPFLRNGTISSRSSPRTRPRVDWILVFSDWVAKHQYLTIAIVTLAGAGALLLHRQRQSHRRRGRAKRRLNGARKEVVIVFGSLKVPIARTVILDLDRRGYIVYVVVSSHSEEETVRMENRVDILPLFLNFTSLSGMGQAVEQLNQILRPRLHSTSSLTLDDMTLSGLIIIPDTSYPMGPSSTVSPEIWSDLLRARVLAPIHTVQALVSLVANFDSKMLFLTPSTSLSLSMPHRTAENTIVAALDGYANTVRNELRSLGVTVHQVKLGSFDLSKFHVPNLGHFGVLSAQSTAQNLAAQIQDKSEVEAPMMGDRLRNTSKGTSLKELNWAIFDVLAGRRRSDVIRVGQGSFSYYMIGTLMPRGLVGWMMGLGCHRLNDHADDCRATADSIQWEKL